MVYGGDGLARLPADEGGRGKAVFIPFVLPGETIEASLTERKPGFVRAKADAITHPSPHRIPPVCPYFGACGGCHYQHATYEQQLEIKETILRETLRRTAKIDFEGAIEIHPSPPFHYRNRSRLQVRVSPSFTAGYLKLASHDLVAVEECPISSPLINRGIAALWDSGRAAKVPEGVREIEFFANADDTQMLVELGCNSEAHRSKIRAWAEDFCAALPEIASITAFRDRKPGAAPENLISIGATHILYRTEKAAYRVSAGSFFQTNRYLVDELVKIATRGRSGQLALDLYAGVGLFSTALACDFHHIVSVEPSQLSSADLSYNQPSNGEAVQATTEQYLARLEDSGRVGTGAVLPHTSYQPDLAVVDPPRSGLGEPVARRLAKLGAPRITYISCDPATLARDLVLFLAAGYSIEQLHLVDLFPQTYHLESVVQLVR
jgi:23S rRNA (uracil1939-C5)-methyltransferase